MSLNTPPTRNPSRVLVVAWLCLWCVLALMISLTNIRHADKAVFFILVWLPLLGTGLLTAWKRWGWLIPCFLWGMTVGWLVNPAFNGAAYRPTWEVLAPLALGGGFGLVLGICCDIAEWHRRV